MLTHLLCKEIPRYENLIDSTERYPDMDPLCTAACMHILHAGDEVFRAVGEIFKHHHLSQGKIMLMIHLFDKSSGTSLELSPAEIADRICVTRATVTGLVDGLEKDGLVERSPDTKDRRMIVVKLTASGIDLLDRVMPLHFKRVKEIMADLSEKENHQLMEMMRKVIDRVRSITPREPSSVSCE